jgi:hypothetical protein
VLVNAGTIIAPAYTYTPAINLLRSKQYQWKVKANGLNAGDFSAPSTFTTSANSPTIPILGNPVNGVLVSSTAPQTLVWMASANAAGYEVEYANNNTFTGATYVTNAASLTAATNLPIGTLLPGRTYFWRVRAWSTANTTGNRSAWSAVRTIKVKYVAPALMSPPDGATGVGNRPTFMWDSNGNALWTSYTLQVSNSASFPATTATRTFTIAAPATTYTIPNTLPVLTAGLKYWRVKINGAYNPLNSLLAPIPTSSTIWSFTP